MSPRPSDLRVKITSPRDIVAARQLSRDLAVELGLAEAEVTLVAAAISEVARNIVEHAQGGEIAFDPVDNGLTRGLQVTARDEGPGIPDVARAMQYGFSTSGGLGVGLPGAKWLMDEFSIESNVGRGTRITMRKWAKSATPVPLVAAV